MSKEKNQSNKKNTTKKTTNKKVTEEKITETKITKATKNNKKNKEEKSNLTVFDTMEEAYDDFEENTDGSEILDNGADLIEEEINLEIEEKKASKDKKKKSDTAEDKIKRIEKIAKEKKVKTSKRNPNETLLWLDKNRYSIYAFLGGVLITVLIAMIIWPDRIATLKNGEQPIVKVGKETYTADELYENMKDYYSVSLLLDQIDDDLLTKLYEENEEMTKEVNSNAEYYLNLYNQYYGYSQEEFLSSNGFANYNEFLEYLKLDYRRNKYLDDYVEKSLTDDEIQKYYDENVFGDINTQHILVEVNTDIDNEEGLKDEDAKKIAEEIITKLNDGTSWEKIQEDYKDKITYEDLSYQAWDASLEESFMTALKEMEDNSYSEEPVKTSYGYHVIYRLDQKEAPKLKKVKDTIIKSLVTEKKSADENLLYKALISLREENKIVFSDTVMKEKYDTYTKQYK